MEADAQKNEETLAVIAININLNANSKRVKKDLENVNEIRIIYIMSLKTHDLNTGDLILCDDLEYKDWGLFSWFIKFMTQSDFSHIAMIVKDPEFTNPPMKGTYVWMSGTSNVPDPEDNKMKFGVQFVPFDEYVKTYGGKLYIRRLHCWKHYELFTTERLKKIHDVVYDKPYDIVISDWIEAYCKKDPHPQKTSRFVCSAFVGYIYTQLTLLPEDTDWSILYPGFFSSENPALRLRHDSNLSREELIHV